MRPSRSQHPQEDSQSAHFQRFSRMSRFLHALLILSFLGLSASGLPLRFPSATWSRTLVNAFGGVHSAGVFHRLFAALLFTVFAAHLVDLHHTSRRYGGWRAMLTGHNSMLPNTTDLRHFMASLRWFLWRGKRPRYERYTYWEKFDYLAVFWGVVVIGSTGLVLCFPQIFARILSGEWINVARIVHSDEALLAVLFIFIVHFFNTHLRPDRFPMDTSIFTGYISVKELRRERAAEYERLQNSTLGDLKLKLPCSRLRIFLFRSYACFALAAGLLLLALVVHELLVAVQ